jgi:hypothetical protein
MRSSSWIWIMSYSEEVFLDNDYVPMHLISTPAYSMQPLGGIVFAALGVLVIGAALIVWAINKFRPW